MPSDDETAFESFVVKPNAYRERLRNEQAILAQEATQAMRPYEYRGSIVCYDVDYWRDTSQRKKSFFSCF